jgi:transcriptional regulator with GAF, ATPase, and Fis domain
MGPADGSTTCTGTDPAHALGALRRATVAFAEAEAELAPAQTLAAALDHLIRVTAADAGAIGVPGEGERQVRFLAERRLGGAGPVSRTALWTALQDEEGRVTITEPLESASVVRGGITSILCAPVRRRGRTLAAVYLDRRAGSPPFDELARELVLCFAAVLALSVDLSRKLERVETRREQAEMRAEEARAVAAHVHDFWRFGDAATKSKRFADCLATAERVARYNVDLLLLGETGTGKEHLARCIHAESGRPGGFVAVNCTALPESIAENELFGHEPGAFTGAQRLHRGTVEQAQDGTLFLDEIGDLPLAIQPKLLRVLEDKRIRRIGGAQEIPISVRIVAATNQDLDKEVREGRFREDLYYRLKVVRLTLPPLRERLEDIPDLSAKLLVLACEEVGRKDLGGWQPEAVRRLAEHDWPGNVRELKNTIKQLCVLAGGPVLTLQDVESCLPALRRAAGPAEPGSRLPLGKPLRDWLQEAERDLLRRAIEQEGSVAGAARLFGVRRQTLHERCQKLGLSGTDAAGQEPRAPD